MAPLLVLHRRRKLKGNIVSWVSPAALCPPLTFGATQGGQGAHEEPRGGCCLGEEKALKSRPLISKGNNGIFWDSH